jgi:sugar lactone lactonase YvrE
MRLHATGPLLALALVTIAQPAYAVPASHPSRLGIVRFVYGGLTVQPPARKQSQGKPRTPLYNQYALRTQLKQKASIGFRDGAILKLNQLTDIVLQNPHKTVVSHGEVAELDLKKGSSHTVQTPVALATAIGTNFDVRVKKAKTTFIVARGAVIVSNHHGKVTVHANHASTVTPGHKPSKPVKVNAQKALNWTQPLAGSDWQTVAPPPDIGRPERVATDSTGTIYVTDRKNTRVIKLSSTGKILTTWPIVNRLTGELAGPMGIAVDSHNNVYVVDNGYGTIQKFTSTGTFIQEFGRIQGAAFRAPGTFDGPTDIAIDQAGDMYITDTAFCRIQKLSPTGAPIAVWGKSCDSRTGDFLDPAGIAVDTTGHVYIADTDNNRIVKLDAKTGQVLQTWGGPRDTKPGDFYGPNDIAIDASGNVYVADTSNYRLQKFTQDGAFLKSWGNVLTNSDATFQTPYGIAVDRAGNLYAVDRTYLRRLPAAAT